MIKNTLGYFALGLVVILSLTASGCSRPQPASASKLKLLVLGIDGLEPSLVETYLGQGKLPNLKKILARGIKQKSAVEFPLISPVIWTSIATGVAPEVHGITDFTLAGKPVDSTYRKVPAFWNILARNKVKGVTIGWWATWPVEHDGGIMVGDRVHWQERPERIFPPQVIDTGKYTLEKYSQGLTFLPRFTKYAYDPGYKTKYAEGEEGFVGNKLIDERLIPIYCRDTINTDIALEIFAKEKPEVLALYLQGVDHVSHAFWKYMQPEPFRQAGLPVSDTDVQLLGTIIPQYYQYVDELLGKLLADCDQDTHFLLLSDHGFGPDVAVVKDSPRLGLSGNHLGEAFFAVAGPGVSPEQANLGKLKAPRQVDFLPTLLYILGLPVAKDLPGQPLAEYFTKEFQQAHPLHSVPTYLTKETKKNMPPAPGDKRKLVDDKKVLDDLRGLGYVK